MARLASVVGQFSWIALENWRNFTKVDVPLHKRVFVYGPNASGKSNLLDAFRFLHDIVSVGGGFQDAVRRRGGVSKIRSLSARSNPAVSISVQIDSTEDTKWNYHVEFRQESKQPPRITRERVVLNGNLLLDRPNESDRADGLLLQQTHLEQVSANRAFRPIFDFFSTIRYHHLVPQLIREPDRSVGRSNDPFGGDFLETLARAPDKTRTRKLGQIRSALRIAVPQLKELELYRDLANGTPHLRGKYEHWRGQGAWQSEEQFSDGTLRLFGLLWIVLDGSGPLLLEEPELSLHPDVVRVIPQLLARVQRKSGRQILITSHSADLLTDTGIGVDEVIVLQPTGEGTIAKSLRHDPQAHFLLEQGESLASLVPSLTSPQNVQQLALLDV